MLIVPAEFQAQYLGRVTSTSYQQLGYFFEHHSMRLLERSTRNDPGLHNLSQTIEKAGGLNSFLLLTKEYPGNLKQPRDAWWKWINLVKTTFCHNFLEQKYPEGNLVAGWRLNGIVRSTLGIRTPFTLPEAFLIGRESDDTLTTSAYYDYRQYLPKVGEANSLKALEDRSARMAANLKRPDLAETIALGLRDQLGLPPSIPITIKPLDKLKLVVVAKPPRSRAATLPERYAEEVLFVGFPSTERLAYFLLQIHQAMLPYQSNWQDYFQAVAPETGSTGSLAG